MTDWTPTFLHLAGVAPPPDIDGINQWDTISKNWVSPRNDIVHNIDEDKQRRLFQATIQAGKWKLIWGQEYLLKRLQPEQKHSVQLYDVYADQSEKFNRANDFQQVVKELQEKILVLSKTQLVEADYPE